VGSPAARVVAERLETLTGGEPARSGVREIAPQLLRGPVQRHREVEAERRLGSDPRGAVHEAQRGEEDQRQDEKRQEGLQEREAPGTRRARPRPALPVLFDPEDD
jgi:hypothetical protein